MRVAGAALVVIVVGLAACRSSSAPPPTSPLAPAVTPAPVAAPAAAAPSAPGATAGRVAVAVTDDGFVPDHIPARRGQPITLAITRQTDHTCARELVIQGENRKTALPLGKTVDVTYTPKTSGQIRFGCAMGMMVSGVLAVSD